MIGGQPHVVIMNDMRFIGGSLGLAEGKTIVLAMDRAINKKWPVLWMVQGGGARLQENIYSMMAIAEVTEARQRLAKAHIPIITLAVGILFGGSSIAALQGDIILAHHDATIGFFGPKLSKSLDSSMDKPNKFKTAEYAYHHGLLDGVINKDMAPDLLIKIISTVTKTTMGGATKVTSPPEFTRQDGWSCVKLSRSGDQPSVRQTINALCDSFVDLHGDRMEGDDPAIIGGIGNIAGKPVILVGHNTPKNNLETQVRAHFGMPHAYGLRKAVRLIELGDQLNYPIITMIDSPGMFVDVSNESVGIAGWAGTLMRSMISVSVPTVGLILGEGASGSALVFALTDRLIMNDRSWFGVIAPESAAKLVWKEDKNMKQTKEMAEALKLDPGYMLDNHITDQVIQWI